jgi:hypothetical protein
VSPDLGVALGAITDKIAPALSEGSTPLLLTPATFFLGEDHDLLSELQRRGFLIKPILLEHRTQKREPALR